MSRRTATAKSGRLGASLPELSAGGASAAAQLSASSPLDAVSDEERQRLEHERQRSERERRKADKLKQKLKQKAMQFSYTARDNARGGDDDEWAED